MSDLVIRNGLAERLRRAAQRHNQPVEVFLESLLDRVSPPAGTLSGLAEAAEKTDIRLGVTDVSGRSREILAEEYEKRAARWMNEEAGDSGA